jgi:hypothetical protein
MAHVDLGLSDDAFGRLSPQQFLALVARWRYRERREDARAALIAMMLGNIYRDAEEHPEPYSVEDFTALLALLPEEQQWPELPKPDPEKAMRELSALVAMVPEAKRAN